MQFVLARGKETRWRQRDSQTETPWKRPQDRLFRGPTCCFKCLRAGADFLGLSKPRAGYDNLGNKSIKSITSWCIPITGWRTVNKTVNSFILYLEPEPPFYAWRWSWVAAPQHRLPASGFHRPEFGAEYTYSSYNRVSAIGGIYLEFLLKSSRGLATVIQTVVSCLTDSLELNEGVLGWIYLELRC